MKKLATTVAVLGLCLGSHVASARDDAPPAIKKRVMKEIGLDDNQIKKIEDLHYRADREKLDIKHEMEKARLDLQHLMSAAQPNEAAVFAQIEKLSAIELKLKKNRIGLMLKIRKLMTPEQWEKLEMFQAQRKFQRRERRERRRRRGMGPGGPPLAPDAPPEPPGPPGPP